MPKPHVHLLVCANERPPESGRASCQPAGGLDLYQRLKDLVRERGLKDRVLVTRTGCLRHCSRGPVVAAWPGNLWCGGVTAADAAELLDTALRGEVPDRLAMPPGPWE